MTQKITQRQQEKGSLLVEVLAVLGLIALITPLIYQQINRRNEDISAANIATEIRSVKDAASAYVMAYEGSIADVDCKLLDEDGKYDETETAIKLCGCYDANCEDPTTLQEFYLGSAETLGDYKVCFYGKTVPTSSAGIYRPAIFAIVYSDGYDNLRRASQIAELVGLDAGIKLGGTDGSVNGMDGTWKLEGSLLPPIGDDEIADYAVVATTAFDTVMSTTILSNLHINHLGTDSVKTTTGIASRLHAQEFFSVGGECIEEVAGDSKILDNEGTCSPVFVVNNNGEVILNETAKITTNKSEPLLEELLTQEEINAGEDAKYQLDPAYTSVMNDIRLTSRGGARLSEILPDYVSKGIEYHTLSADVGEDISQPACPAHYAPALVILPIVGDSGTELSTTGNDLQGNINITVLDTHEVTISGTVAVPITKKSATVVQTEISSTDPTRWTISSDMGISVIVQTYCVYDGETTTEKTRRPQP